MTGFRPSWLLVAAAVAMLLASGSTAQEVTVQPASGPPTALGSGPTSPSPGSVAPSPVDSSSDNPQSHVQVRSLGSVDGPPIGLLGSADGGLGRNIWQQTSRLRAEQMLKRAPLATPVASVRALGRQLVLTTADAPVGDAPAAFLSVRLRALLDAGMLRDAGALAAQATPKDDPELARLVADSILLAGRTSDVCGPATNTRLENSERFWIKLRAFCYAMAGDLGALDLTRAVLQAQKMDNRGFEMLLDDYVSHRNSVPARVSEPDSVDVFLLQKVALPVDPGWSQHMGMPLSVIAMRDTKNSAEERLEAAEEAAPAGAATVVDLAEVADAQIFTPEQLSSAESEASTLPFLAGQALLRQAARNASDPETKKTLLFEALALAEGKNLVPLVAQLQGSAASAIVPERADRGHAAAMISALMLGRRAEAAERWNDVLDLNAPQDRPLMHLVRIELNLISPNSARALEAQGALSWFVEQANAPQPDGGDETLSYALLALGTYDALDLVAPPETKAALAQLKSRHWQGRAPDQDVLSRLAAARHDGGDRAEAILSMLDFMGTDGPGDVAPDATVAFVAALAQMGLADAAHDLAVDALLMHRSASTSAPAQ